MNLLHIDSSVLGDNSVTRDLSARIAARLSAEDAAPVVVYRDLVAEPIAHFTAQHLGGTSAAVQNDQALQDDLALGGRVLEEFLAADTIVIGAPMYNFTISSQLKAWIDRILVAGKTFRYTEAGPVGLAGAKRVVIAIARGGFYGPETPMIAFEHVESYLRNVFSFVGVENLEIVAAEGIALGADARAAAMHSAREAIATLDA